MRAALPRISAAGTHSLKEKKNFFFREVPCARLHEGEGLRKEPLLPPRRLSAYVFAMSIGEPGWGAAAFDVGLGAITGGPPGLTMVGGIAGLTKRSDVRLLDGATMCPYFNEQFTNENK